MRKAGIEQESHRKVIGKSQDNAGISLLDRGPSWPPEIALEVARPAAELDFVGRGVRAHRV